MLVSHISNRDSEKLTFLGLAGIAFLGLVLYSNILHAPFVFDDYSSILDNETIKNVRTAFRDLSNNRYLAYLSFALNYSANGAKPFGYHFINNLIHAVNALLVCWFVLLTFKTPAMSNASRSGEFIAFASAFIFVAHPIHTQAVTYIAQRVACMATLFYLLSLVMYVKSRLITMEKPEERKSKGLGISFSFLGISVITAVFAMKSKEIAFTLPLMIVLYEFSFFSETWSYKVDAKSLRRWFYLLPILLTILIIPLSMMDFAKPAKILAEHIDAQTKETLNTGRTDYLLTEFRVIVTYLRLLIFPVKQSIDYTYPVYHSMLQWQVFLSFLALLSFFSLGIYLYWRSRASLPGLRLIAFGIFWFFLTLSVESSIIPIRDVIFEHRLYLPSIGFFIAAITMVDYVFRRPKVKVGLIICIVGILSVSTYNRNRIWQDPQTLWENVLEKFPNNVRAYNALGVILKNDSQHDKAAEQFQKILAINPTYPPAYYNLGDIRLKLGDYAGAIKHFKKALSLNLTHRFQFDTLISLAIAYSEMGDNENAVATFREAVKRYPAEISPYNNLGRQYIIMGEADLAIETLEKALRIRESSHLYYNLSLAYKLKGDKQKSEAFSRKALMLTQ